MTLNLDQSDYNEHEIMANLTAVINHMVDAKVIVLPDKVGYYIFAIIIFICYNDKSVPFILY